MYKSQKKKKNEVEVKFVVIAIAKELGELSSVRNVVIHHRFNISTDAITILQ